MRWWDEECIEEGDSVFMDPLMVERSRPVTDEEARRFEEICLAATPGPLVVDDQSEGGGMLVAYLPDGRSLVRQDADQLSSADPFDEAEANAKLFCRARSMVLRLLRDRRHWRRREQAMRKRVDFLEAELERRQQLSGPSRWDEDGRAVVRPR